MALARIKPHTARVRAQTHRQIYVIHISTKTKEMRHEPIAEE